MVQVQCIHSANHGPLLVRGANANTHHTYVQLTDKYTTALPSFVVYEILIMVLYCNESKMSMYLGSSSRCMRRDSMLRRSTITSMQDTDQ
jgi:hypothetical protein